MRITIAICAVLICLTWACKNTEPDVDEGYLTKFKDSVAQAANYVKGGFHSAEEEAKTQTANAGEKAEQLKGIVENPLSSLTLSIDGLYNYKEEKKADAKESWQEAKGEVVDKDLGDYAEQAKEGAKKKYHQFKGDADDVYHDTKQYANEAGYKAEKYAKDARDTADRKASEYGDWQEDIESQIRSYWRSLKNDLGETSDDWKQWSDANKAEAKRRWQELTNKIDEKYRDTKQWATGQSDASRMWEEFKDSVQEKYDNFDDWMVYIKESIVGGWYNMKQSVKDTINEAEMRYN